MLSLSGVVIFAFAAGVVASTGTPTRRMDLAGDPGTNAQRFALGLPPLPPHRRDPNAAPGAATSPLPPLVIRCNIMGTAQDGTVLGFISPFWEGGMGQYGTFQPLPLGALEVSFPFSPDSPGRINLKAKNSPDPTYPFFGGVVGVQSSNSNIGRESSNYIALAGTVETPPGATPDANFDNSYVHGQAVESAIWSYDPLTQILAPDWINTNGGEPQPDIIWGAGYPFLMLVGDPRVLPDFGPNAGLKPLSFTCVPPVDALI
ncbi:hypothetical protein B0H14DRAFT_3764722 [Mycena olivaceomarginata]|nr:hypothetical protein B0H14DRAFT_3764722 [Mycena olivaceomarginata]